jgi:hypothetical protein
MRNHWRTREAAHVDCVRKFVDQRHCQHECGTELLGGRRRGKGVGVRRKHGEILIRAFVPRKLSARSGLLYGEVEFGWLLQSCK